jgi:hypothetical protein
MYAHVVCVSLLVHSAMQVSYEWTPSFSNVGVCVLDFVDDVSFPAYTNQPKREKQREGARDTVEAAGTSSFLSL